MRDPCGRQSGVPASWEKGVKRATYLVNREIQG